MEFYKNQNPKTKMDFCIKENFDGSLPRIDDTEKTSVLLQSGSVLKAQEYQNSLI